MSTKNVKNISQWIKKVQAEEYKRDENVLVGMGYGSKKSNTKRRFVVERTIFQNEKHSGNCKVFLIPPGINTSELEVSIEDLTFAAKANRTTVNHVTSHIEINNLLLHFNTDCRVLKIKAKVTLVIFLVMTIVIFLHFRISSE